MGAVVTRATRRLLTPVGPMAGGVVDLGVGFRHIGPAPIRPHRQICAAALLLRRLTAAAQWTYLSPSLDLLATLSAIFEFRQRGIAFNLMPPT